jgi:hypothetical protein
VLPDLLNQISLDEQIESLSGDGAYDTTKVHSAVADQGAQAIIPVRKMGNLGKIIHPGLKPAMKHFELCIDWAEPSGVVIIVAV